MAFGSLAARALLVVACSPLSFAARISRRSTNTARVKVYDALPGDDVHGWVVFFDKASTNEDIDDFCREAECELRGNPSKGGVPFAAVRGADANLSSIFARRSSGVSFAAPNLVIDEGDEEPDVVPTASASWGLDRIGVPSTSLTGRGVSVYVLDSGVRATHEDFGGRVIPALDASGWGSPKECNGRLSCAKDGRGHGTHVAGTVGGATHGVAKLATIRSINRGNGWSTAYSCMDWVATNAVKPAVLQMSFGTQKLLDGSEIAADTVVQAGVTVVVNAGNWNSPVCEFTFGYIASTITVGATAPGDKRASFSNYGTCVTLFAPGESITSTDYGSDTKTSAKTGTSMAAPHVSGVVALYLQNSPAMQPSQVKQRLLSEAEQGVLGDLKTGDPNTFLKAP